MDIRIFKTLADLNESFTLLLREIAARSKSTSIALSGGSTPKTLFDYWAFAYVWFELCQDGYPGEIK